MSQNASQPHGFGYIKGGFFIALFSAIGTFTGVGIAYLAWQYPKSPNVGPQKPVTAPVAATPTPNTFPSDIPNTFPSATPTPKVEARRRPTKRTKYARPKPQPCFIQGKGGELIRVDCETGEYIGP